jgi:hypothetical protein
MNRCSNSRRLGLGISEARIVVNPCEVRITGTREALTRTGRNRRAKLLRRVILGSLLGDHLLLMGSVLVAEGPGSYIRALTL